jgi:hypothetical protein
MPDPLCVIGSMGALCNIIDIVGKTISTINKLRLRWKDADLVFLCLATQLVALRAALQQIEDWTDNDVEDFHHQLIIDLDAAISCCRLLVDKLDTFFCEIDWTTNQELGMHQKAKTVFGASGMDGVQKLIDSQTNALTLLLSACNR